MLREASVLQNPTYLNIIAIVGNLFPNYLTVNIKLSEFAAPAISNSMTFERNLEGQLTTHGGSVPHGEENTRRTGMKSPFIRYISILYCILLMLIITIMIFKSYVCSVIAQFQHLTLFQMPGRTLLYCSRIRKENT